MIKLIYNFHFVIFFLPINAIIFSQTVTILPTPDRNNSFETRFLGVNSLAIDKRSLFLMSKDKGYFEIKNLDEQKNPKTDFQFSKKIPIKANRRKRMNFINLLGEKGYTILNGIDLELYFYSVDHRFVSNHSLIYDLILPPQDRGGEAPTWEISSTRANFLNNLKKVQEEKISGVTKIPPTWATSSRKAYLLSSRIQNFPILMMTCENDNPTQCRIKRHCFTKNLNIPPKSTSGITIHEKSKTILIANSKDHKIIQLRYYSCFHIVKKNEILLPKRLKRISNILIDDHDNLWISTEFQDDYYNSTVFRWKSSEWMP